MTTISRFPDSGTLSRTTRCLLGAGIFLIVSLTTSSSQAAGFAAQRIATGFTLPVYACAPAGDTSRLFVAEQGGKIKIINLPSGTVNPTPFLDISDIVPVSQGGGILGMTFDPNYAVNGRFYVSYTLSDGGAFGMGDSHIARFTVTADPNIADHDSEVTVLTVDQTNTDHNVDWIGFSNRRGDEGNLYICSGDGGPNEDRGPNHPSEGNAQNTQTLLGKILRIHIEDDGSYTIPSNNPFFGSQTDKQEIWAFGLRNPFRASFDRRTGDMLIGDVGERNREELDVNLPSNPGGGENYGWRVREGFYPNPFYLHDPKPPDAVDPILDYSHDTTGTCVIGGYVYRGTAVKALSGLYIFGDCFGPEGGNFTGRIFTLRYRKGAGKDFRDITSQLFPTREGFRLGVLSSFGEDANGEIYIVDVTNGSVFKLTSGR